MKAQTSAQLIRAYYERKLGRVQGLSLGVLARQVKLSTSNVSRIFSGKRKLQFKQIELFSQILEIDEVGKNEIRQQLIRERLGSEVLENRAAGEKLVSENEPMELAPRKFHFLLEKWYYLAILELVTCKHYRHDPAWIAAQLGISIGTAQNAILLLVESGCIFARKGRWHKNKDKIRFPNGRETQLYNRYQKENLRRATMALGAFDEKSLKERLVLGGTVAVNSQNIEKARAILNQAAVEALHLLCEGECDQVFQLSTILIPLTKPKA